LNPRSFLSYCSRLFYSLGLTGRGVSLFLPSLFVRKRSPNWKRVWVFKLYHVTLDVLGVCFVQMKKMKCLWSKPSSHCNSSRFARLHYKVAPLKAANQPDFGDYVERKNYIRLHRL
jgi:hypothetical protein